MEMVQLWVLQVGWAGCLALTKWQSLSVSYSETIGGAPKLLAFRKISVILNLKQAASALPCVKTTGRLRSVIFRTCRICGTDIPFASPHKSNSYDICALQLKMLLFSWSNGAP